MHYPLLALHSLPQPLHQQIGLDANQGWIPAIFILKNVMECRVYIWPVFKGSKTCPWMQDNKLKLF